LFFAKSPHFSATLHYLFHYSIFDKFLDNFCFLFYLFLSDVSGTGSPYRQKQFSIYLHGKTVLRETAALARGARLW